MYSAALCRGLIEAGMRGASVSGSRRYSAALCRGLIEAASPARRSARWLLRIPRLYAAASLKPYMRTQFLDELHDGIPRLYAAASLKHVSAHEVLWTEERVFRGSMPRPH